MFLGLVIIEYKSYRDVSLIKGKNLMQILSGIKVVKPL